MLKEFVCYVFIIIKKLFMHQSNFDKYNNLRNKINQLCPRSDALFNISSIFNP